MLVIYKASCWTATVGPFFFLGFLTHKSTLIEKFSKDALIHTLYQTFLFIISVFVWVSLRGRTETGSQKSPPKQLLASFPVQPWQWRPIVQAGGSRSKLLGPPAQLFVSSSEVLPLHLPYLDGSSLSNNPSAKLLGWRGEERGRE